MGGGEWDHRVARPKRIACEMLSFNTSLMRVDSASKGGLRRGPEGYRDRKKWYMMEDEQMKFWAFSFGPH